MKYINKYINSIKHLGVVGGGSRDVGLDGGVLGLSGVGDLSNVAIVVVGVVVDSLDSAIGKVDRVRSLHNTGAIVGLALAEGGTGVLVSNTVVVRVGGDLGQVRVGVASRVGHGVVDGGVGDHRVGNSVSNNSVSYKTVPSDKTVSKTMSGQELRGGRGGGHKGGDTGEGLEGDK